MREMLVIRPRGLVDIYHEEKYAALILGASLYLLTSLHGVRQLKHLSTSFVVKL